MGWVELVLAVVKSSLDFFRPKDDTVVAYDIKKDNANKYIWIFLAVLIFMVIAVVLSIVLSR